jgi:hypothetical protein
MNNQFFHDDFVEPNQFLIDILKRLTHGDSKVRSFLEDKFNLSFGSFEVIEFKVLSADNKHDSSVSFLVMLLTNHGWTPFRVVLKHQFNPNLTQGWQVIHFGKESISHPIMDI